MGLQLHPSCKDQLKKAIIENYELISLSGAIFIDRFPIILELMKFDSSLPDSKYTLLQAHYGHNPFSSFCVDYIERKLRRIPEQRLYQVNKLIELDEFSDKIRIADEIVNSFDEIPYNYRLFTPIPSFITEDSGLEIDQINLGNSSSIIFNCSDFDEKYPVPERRPRNALIKPFSPHGDIGFYWGESSIFFQYDCEGYVGLYGSSTLIDDFHDTLKAFFGMLISLNLASYKHDIFSGPSEQNISIFKRNGSLIEYDCQVNLDEDRFQPLSNIKWLTNIYSIDNIVAGMKTISNVMSQVDNKNNRILRSSQWLFDSMVSKNELLKFVQATVSMEILLGDEKRSPDIGIASLLRNRCAYLIATSQTEREEIIEDFNDIYGIRSKIVHAGKSRLDQKEKILLNKLQLLCKKAIVKEIFLSQRNA